MDRKIYLRHRAYLKRNPWVGIFGSINSRCRNPNQMHWDRYGGRGIESRITSQEIKTLWFRDKAYLMEHPSIDRKDNDGHYRFSNCRFIERSANQSRNKGKEKELPYTAGKKSLACVLLHDMNFYREPIEAKSPKVKNEYALSKFLSKYKESKVIDDHPTSVYCNLCKSIECCKWKEKAKCKKHLILRLELNNMKKKLALLGRTAVNETTNTI